MAHMNGHFMNLRDVLRGEMNANYNLLNAKIENLQKRNNRMSGRMNVMENQLKEAQTEIAKQRAEIVKLHGENNMLAASNMKIGEMDAQIKHYETIIMKIEYVDLTQIKSTAHQTKSDLNALKTQIESNFNQLNQKTENLTSELKKTQDKIEENEITMRFSTITKAMDDEAIQTEKNPEIYNYQSIKFGKTFHQQSQNRSISYTWKINGIKEILRKRVFSIESDAFVVDGYPFKAKAKLSVANRGNVYVTLAFIDESAIEKSLRNESFKGLPSATYTLKDLRGTNKDLVLSIDCEFDKLYYFNEFYYERWVKPKYKLLKSNYVANDSILIGISMEPPSVAHAIVSSNGILNAAIDNYSLRKQGEVDDLERGQPCPYFYTSSNGYRVKVNLFLNGSHDFRRKGLTASIEFVNGKNDLFLCRCFAHKTTITVFNHLNLTRNYERTVEWDIKDGTFYMVQLLLHDELLNGGFLINDTLYFEVVIKSL